MSIEKEAHARYVEMREDVAAGRIEVTPKGVLALLDDLIGWLVPVNPETEIGCYNPGSVVDI